MIETIAAALIVIIIIIYYEKMQNYTNVSAPVPAEVAPVTNPVKTADVPMTQSRAIGLLKSTLPSDPMQPKHAPVVTHDEQQDMISTANKKTEIPYQKPTTFIKPIQKTPTPIVDTKKNVNGSHNEIGHTSVSQTSMPGNAHPVESAKNIIQKMVNNLVKKPIPPPNVNPSLTIPPKPLVTFKAISSTTPYHIMARNVIASFNLSSNKYDSNGMGYLVRETRSLPGNKLITMDYIMSINIAYSILYIPPETSSMIMSQIGRPVKIPGFRRALTFYNKSMQFPVPTTNEPFFQATTNSPVNGKYNATIYRQKIGSTYMYFFDSFPIGTYFNASDDEIYQNFIVGKAPVTPSINGTIMSYPESSYKLTNYNFE